MAPRYTGDLTFYTGQKAASGDNSVVAAPGANKRIVVKAIVVQNTTATATTVVLKDGATAKHTSLLQNQGDMFGRAFEFGYEWQLTANTALVVNLSGANSHNVNVEYWIEDV